MADAKKIIKGGLNIAKRVLADGEETLTAAQRAEAGRKAAELIKSQPQVKASEALGQQMERGMKRTTTTQADRTRVGGGNIGGAPFSAISEADPAYAGKVWGVMDEGTAARLKNLTDPQTAWTTMLGSANQLKTNPIVFDKLKRQFLDAMKQGKLSPELEAKINHNLALNFGEGAQIRDPSIWKQADTFEKRAALADLMMGQGITPKKGGVALGGEKSGKGVIFKPTDTLIRETEPSLLHTEHGGDTPTFAAGPRLFTLEKESVYRPDLHPGFPTLLTGKDLEVNMIPTPTEVYLPEWHKQFKKRNPDRKPGYYDLALGVKGEGLPSQDLNDEYIRHLLREGFKDGGEVDIKAADARLAKAIENRMAKGGAVDLEAADARLSDAIAKRMGMADGGEVGFKKIQFMADGGKMVKGLGKIAKRLMADETPKTLSAGDVVNGMIVRKDIPNTSSIGASLSDYSTHGLQEVPMSAFETVGKPRYRSAQEEKRTKELARQIQENKELNPLIVVKDAEGHYILEGGHRFDALRELGIDSFPALMVHDLESLRTIAKADGGSVFKKLTFMDDGGVPHMAGGGKLKALGKIGKRLLADPEAVTPAISSGTRKFGDDAGGLNIIKETGGNWSPSGSDVYKSNLDRQLEKLDKGRYDLSSKYIKQMLEDATLRGDASLVAKLTRDLRDAIGNEAASKWVQSNLKNYITKQMATEADPVRKLAEKGIKAFPVNIDEYGDAELRTYGSAQAKQNRKNTGYVPEGLAKSPLAKHYETMTDESISMQPAKEYQRMQNLPKMQRPAGTMDSPWLLKLDPDTPIFSLNRDVDFDKLGFTHMMDVLREDVAAGRIRPEQLSKITIEQAVRRTHDYDETLKANMLNARIAEQANANVFKEYPEGYRWVQLDKPGQFALESDIMGHSVRGYEPPKGHPDYTDISGNSGSSDYGHGGYEAIKSGDAKIYSLRDPKGRSHVTVEVGTHNPNLESLYAKQNLPELYAKYKANRNDYFNSWPEFLKKEAPELLNAKELKITQIKGKQNAAPNEEYLPFVQDFVKSGNWSDVGDLRNTGLRDINANPNDLLPAHAEKIGLKLPRYLTEKERKDLYDHWDTANFDVTEIPESLLKYKANPKEGMAQGGGAFKKLQFMDKGGITTSGGTFSAEELGVNPSDLVADEKLSKKLKRGIAREIDIGKEQLEQEYRQLGNKGGKRDAAIRIGSQIAGSGVDIANMGLEGLDFLQSLVPALSKPESVLDIAGTGDRVPKFKLAFDNPALGSDNLIRKFKEAGLLGENEFPLTEFAANLVVPTAAVSALRKGKQAYKGAKALVDTPKKRQGGLTAMAR